MLLSPTTSTDDNEISFSTYLKDLKCIQNNAREEHATITRQLTELSKDLEESDDLEDVIDSNEIQHVRLQAEGDSNNSELEIVKTNLKKSKARFSAMKQSMQQKLKTKQSLHTKELTAARQEMEKMKR